MLENLWTFHISQQIISAWSGCWNITETFWIEIIKRLTFAHAVFFLYKYELFALQLLHLCIFLRCKYAYAERKKFFINVCGSSIWQYDPVYERPGLYIDPVFMSGWSVFVFFYLGNYESHNFERYILFDIEIYQMFKAIDQT